MREGKRLSPHEARVERYYDFIYHWAQITNRFRAFASPGAYAIHRGMVDPVTGEFSTDTVHRLIAAHLPAAPDFKGLDAGCGYAGTMIELRQRTGGDWHGITVSKRQVLVARRNIAALGLAGHVRVSQASFDQPLGSGLYDVAIGIESLIHSRDPALSIAQLAAALKPGGKLIIVDDMPVPDMPEALAADLAAFKATWGCPVAPGVEGWRAHLVRAGLDIQESRDLTAMTCPRSEQETREALDDVTRKRVWRDRLGLKLVSDAQQGGLHLERLLREGAIRYVMIVATKPMASKSEGTRP